MFIYNMGILWYLIFSEVKLKCNLKTARFKYSIYYLFFFYVIFNAKFIKCVHNMYKMYTIYLTRKIT